MKARRNPTVKEIFTMWKYTKMVVLTTVTAALYAGLMIPFKAIVIVPGFTELRPAVAIPVVFGLLFGPAGAWGAAIGNLIADALGGMFGPASTFGFVGNFFLGAIPCALWGRLPFFPQALPLGFRSPAQLGQFAVVTLLASLACAATVGLGVEVFHFFPFVMLALIVAINDLVMPLLIGPALMSLLVRRVQSWGLLWTDILLAQDRSRQIAPRLGAMLIAGGSLGAFLVGTAISVSVYGAQVGQAYEFGRGPFGPTVVAATSPFLALVLLGFVLL